MFHFNVFKIQEGSEFGTGVRQAEAVMSQSVPQKKKRAYLVLIHIVIETSLIRSIFLCFHFPKIDHRIGISMLKLVCAEHVMLCGLEKLTVKSKEISKYSKQKTPDRTVQTTYSFQCKLISR